MRVVGGFRSVADLEAFGRELEDQEFHVDVKPYGKLKCLEISSDNIEIQLYLREASIPDKQGALTVRDGTLMEIIKAKYPYEGVPKFQFSC